jgi:hypothetical protein
MPRKPRRFEYVDPEAGPPRSEVPKKPKKAAVAPIKVEAEPVAPVTPLVVRKPFTGQTPQDIDAINRANMDRPGYAKPKRLPPDLSAGPKKIGSCGTGF